MFSDSDTETFEDEELEDYAQLESGGEEGIGLGLVVTLCVVGVFVLVVACDLKSKIFKC